MAQKPSYLIYGLDDSPPRTALLLLGLQHVFVISVAFIFPVVIVRTMGGTLEQATFMVTMAMLAAGIGTILQALHRKGMGSGYLCPAVCGPSFLSASILAAQTGGLSLLFGMTAVAGGFEIIFSRVIHRLRAFFPAEVAGVVVTMVGVAVIPVAMPNFLGIGPADTVTELYEILVAVLTLGTMIGISVWSRGRLRLYSVIIGITVGYIAAVLFGLLNASHLELVLRAPFAALPDFSHLGWSFDIALLIPFIIAILCSSLKTVGDITTCQKINDADWRRPDLRNIGSGVLADGTSALLGGLMGTMGQSTSSSNIGLSLGTGATSRMIAFSAGAILVLLTFIPKLSTIFVIMPATVMGAALVFVASFMIVTGLQIITSRMMDARKTFVVGVSFIIGFSVDTLPGIYAGAPAMIQPVFSSSLAAAAITALLLNLIFRIGIVKRKVIELEPGTDFSDKIFTFFEKEGGMWGARKEVVTRAISAMTEFMESATFLGLTQEKIRAEVLFDEYSLDVEMQYVGKPLDLSPTSRPTDEDLMTDESALTRLSTYLICRSADGVFTENKDGLCVVRFHFDH